MPQPHRSPPSIWSVLFILVTGFTLALAGVVRAEPPRRHALTRPLEVRRTAEPGDPVVQTLSPGEVVWIVDERDGLTRIKYRRAQAWRAGFVLTDDLSADEVAAPRTLAGWKVGVVGAYSILSQGARRFTTEDQVKWATSNYASDTIWPAAYAQTGGANFWRVGAGLRRVSFRGNARADVGVENTRSIRINQDMISVRLERGWALVKPAYLSVGVEAARALQISATIGGVRVPTSGEDIKIYAGGSIGVGANFAIARSWVGFVEARAGAYPTLSPIPYVFEAAAGAGYAF